MRVCSGFCSAPAYFFPESKWKYFADGYIAAKLCDHCSQQMVTKTKDALGATDKQLSVAPAELPEPFDKKLRAEWKKVLDAGGMPRLSEELDQ